MKSLTRIAVLLLVVELVASDQDQVPTPTIRVQFPVPPQKDRAKAEVKSIRRINDGATKKSSPLIFPIAYPSSPTPDDRDQCICVPAYLCVGDQIAGDFDGADSETRHGYGWHCGIKNYVCCRPTPPTPTPTSTVVPGYSPKCGSLNPSGVNARVLGTGTGTKESDTQFGEYPWMAAVLEPKLINGEKSYKFICGGALIWPSVVITAAHCVQGKSGSSLLVRLGEWDTQSTNEFYPHQDILASEIVIHPQYYAGGLYYDVALIFLSSSAVLAPHIDTICLPEVNPNYENSSCWATGWGKDQFGKAGSYQVILKEVQLPITSKPICERALRKTNLGLNFNLHSSFLCAGGFKDLDTCVGDGGGGLVCPSAQDPWRYVLAGLVSWGVGCGDHGVPGVYVDVTKVRPWIDLTMSARIPWYDLSRVTVTGDARRRG